MKRVVALLVVAGYVWYGVARAIGDGITRERE